VVDEQIQLSSHDTLPADTVIGIVEAEGALHPGDQVVLLVSKGPPPVLVPEIVGKTWNEAKQILGDAGLSWAYWSGGSESLATLVPNLSRVVGTDPGAGTTVPRGSTIRVRLVAE